MAIGCGGPKLFFDTKAGYAGELNEIAAVAAFGELRDTAEAADLVELGMVGRSRMRGIGLDHADEAMAATQRIVDHRQIAWLENIERHLPARQQQRTGEREHRDHIGEVAGTVIGLVYRHRRTPTRNARTQPSSRGAGEIPRLEGWRRASNVRTMLQDAALYAAPSVAVQKSASFLPRVRHADF